MQKICMFCGNDGGNREHIISKWILRDLNLYGVPTKIGIGVQHSTGRMDTLQESQPLGSFVTDQICQTCNNGWMSGLEKTVKPMLLPLLLESWPANDLPIFQSFFLQSAAVTRWLLKTACTFGERMATPVPENLKKMLHEERLHPEIMADISYNTQCGYYIGISRSWNVSVVRSTS